MQLSHLLISFFECANSSLLGKDYKVKCVDQAMKQNNVEMGTIMINHVTLVCVCLPSMYNDIIWNSIITCHIAD